MGIQALMTNWQAKLWRMIRSEYQFPHPALLISEFISKASNSLLGSRLITKETGMME